MYNILTFVLEEMEETLKREKDQKERKFLLTTNVSRKNEHVVFFEVAVGVTDRG